MFCDGLPHVFACKCPYCPLVNTMHMIQMDDLDLPVDHRHAYVYNDVIRQVTPQDLCKQTDRRVIFSQHFELHTCASGKM